MFEAEALNHRIEEVGVEVRVKVKVTVTVGVGLSVDVNVGVGVGLEVKVRVGVEVIVGVGVTVGVEVGLEVTVKVEVNPPRFVAVEVAVGVAVGVFVGAAGLPGDEGLFLAGQPRRKRPPHRVMAAMTIIGFLIPSALFKRVAVNNFGCPLWLPPSVPRHGRAVNFVHLQARAGRCARDDGEPVAGLDVHVVETAAAARIGRIGDVDR